MEEFEREPHIIGRGFSVARIEFDRPVHFQRHGHRAANLVLVYAGTWRDCAVTSLEIRPGEILLQPANTTHENHADRGSEIIIADLHRDFLGEICLLYGDRPRTCRYPFEAFEDLPIRLRDEVMRNDAPSVFLIEALLLHILAAGARLADAVAPKPVWLLRVTTHIHTHAHQELTLAGLAEVASLSRSRLSHGFREHTGKSIMAYTREYRLRIAARALRQTGRPIKDIALTFCFYDHAHFSREFAKLYGLAPLEYRRRMQFDARSASRH